MERTEALVAIAVLAGAALPMSSSRNNPPGNLNNRHIDDDYGRFNRVFRDYEARVKGNLSGPPGLSAHFVSLIRDFRVDVQKFSTALPQNVANQDMIEQLRRHFLVSGRWLERNTVILQEQKALVRNMKDSGTARLTYRPLDKPIDTQNETLSIGYYNQALMGERTQQTNRLNPDGTFVKPGDQAVRDIFMPGQQAGSFNEFQGGALTIGGAPNLNDSHLVFSQGDPPPDMMDYNANRDINVGLVPPKHPMAMVQYKAGVNIPFDYSPPARSPADSETSLNTDQMFIELGNIDRLASRLKPTADQLATFGETSTMAGGSIYGAAPPSLLVKNRPDPPEQKSSAPTTPAQNPVANFNQQGDFNSKDLTQELIDRTREQSQAAMNDGLLSKAVVLRHQADMQEFGEIQLTTPTKALVPIAEYTRSPGGTKDSEFFAAIRQIQEDIDRTDKVGDIEVFINMLQKTVPAVYRNSPGSFTIPNRRDVIDSAEYRAWRRIYDDGVEKRNRSRPRSVSFSSPRKAGAPKQTKKFKTALEGLPQLPGEDDMQY